VRVINSELEAAGEPVKTSIAPRFRSAFEPLINKLCDSLASPPSGELKAAVRSDERLHRMDFRITCFW